VRKIITVSATIGIALLTTGIAYDLFIEGKADTAASVNPVLELGSVSTGINAKASNPSRRIPAEWEPHEATWMQWPRASESFLRQNFSAIVDLLQDYEPINILVESADAKTQAQNYLVSQGVSLTNITWHIMAYDWSWMRDNGPVWSIATSELIVQDWGFDGWGLGPPYENDDAIPCQVATIEAVPCETYELINERGNLEFNGAGALIVNWICQSDRNPGVSRTEMETLFQQAFGVTQVVWLLRAPSDDITKGHVDGIARFIDEDTVAVTRYTSQTDPDASVYEEAASIIQNAGFEVERVEMPGYVRYYDSPLPANYMNWLVANGVVIVPGFGVSAWDSAAKATIEDFFPGHDVVVVEILDIWNQGGGVHCVTNDQPAIAGLSLTIDSGDYNGDGSSDIAIFRKSSGLWAVRGITRAYFGSSSDIPVPGDYDGDGSTEIGIFRSATGLWALRDVTRTYFGSSADSPEPGDYDGDGTEEVGLFRPGSGLWAIQGVTRAYFGGGADSPDPGYYEGSARKNIAVFRGTSGLWAIRDLTRIYFGSAPDTTVPGDYNGDQTWKAGIFRPASGLWAIQGVSRAYFGGSTDDPVPADYNGDGADDIGIFRASSGLWAIKGVSRVYFGSSGDTPVVR